MIHVILPYASDTSKSLGECLRLRSTDSHNDTTTTNNNNDNDSNDNSNDNTNMTNTCYYDKHNYY